MPRRRRSYDRPVVETTSALPALGPDGAARRVVAPAARDRRRARRVRRLRARRRGQRLALPLHAAAARATSRRSTRRTSRACSAATSRSRRRSSSSGRRWGCGSPVTTTARRTTARSSWPRRRARWPGRGAALPRRDGVPVHPPERPPLLPVRRDDRPRRSSGTTRSARSSSGRRRLARARRRARLARAARERRRCSSLFTFGCNSLRHLVGGKLDCFTCSRSRADAPQAVARRHACSTCSTWSGRGSASSTVGLADLYIRLAVGGRLPRPEDLLSGQSSRRTSTTCS